MTTFIWQIRNLVGLSFPTPEKEVELRRQFPMNVRPAEAFEINGFSMKLISRAKETSRILAFPQSSSRRRR